MEENKRKPRKPENPVREWISDNLRYILLIALIAAIALVIWLVVSGVKKKNAPVENPVVETTVTPEATPEVTEAPVENTPEAEAEATKTPAPTKAPEKNILEDAPEEVQAVVNTYFVALENADADAAAAVMEKLSDADRAEISNAQFAQHYGNIETYIYEGDNENSLVAFVTYDYTYPESDKVNYGLTQLYLVKGADGKLLIADEKEHPGAADYMTRLLQREDVKKLISSVEEKNAN